MRPLPRRVMATFSRLKKKSSKYIEIKRIKNYYFVYQSTSRWDKERKKPIKVLMYLGRIANSGEFIQASKKKPRKAESLPIPVDGITSNSNQVKLENPIKTGKPYKYEATLLTALSMNGRIPTSVLGRMVGLKDTAVSVQVKKLEKSYNIKYIAEIDPSKLGYLRFLITVSFLEQYPKMEFLKEILSKEPLVQTVLIIKGNADMIVYALAENGAEINALVFRLRKDLDYKATWNAAPVFDDYGYFPIKKEFIELISNKFLKREFAVLKELINNGNIDFSEIDRIHGFDRGRSQYSYYKLREKGIIKRITITMETLPIKYIAAIFEDIIDFKLFSMNREKVLRDIIATNDKQINKYLFVEDTSNPAGLVYYLPVFADGDLEKTIERLNPASLGVNVRPYIVTSILIGNFCYRNFDNSYSSQQATLIKDYGDKNQTKLNYEETGRTKKEKIDYIKDIRGVKG